MPTLKDATLNTLRNVAGTEAASGVMDAMIEIAKADGEIDEPESEVLRQAAEALGEDLSAHGVS